MGVRDVSDVDLGVDAILCTVVMSEGAELDGTCRA